MTDQTPNIYPFLRFADADVALEWLGQAFGFTELMVHRGEDGNGPVIHAEISLGPGIVMVGQGDPLTAASTSRSTMRTRTTSARRPQAPRSCARSRTRPTARASTRLAIRRETSGASARTGRA